MLGDLIQGDCLDVMRGMDAESVDLIMTSPPYADARMKTYGGVMPDDYVDWFLPRAAEMKRILKPSGSFVLNIKEKCVDGERHTYVLELILAMRRELGWRWCEEYVWNKTCSLPGKWIDRFRDSWERLIHFTLDRRFKMNQESVKVSASESTRKNYYSYRGRSLPTMVSKTGSGLVWNPNAYKEDVVFPSNVLTESSACYNSGHSAAFPLSLPTFFVKLFTDAGDVVLDPFCGSATTCEAAQRLDRRWIGIDNNEHSIRVAKDRMNKVPVSLFAPVQEVA